MSALRPPTTKTVYEYRCTKSWTSFRPGSVVEEKGTCETLGEANEWLDAIYDRLRPTFGDYDDDANGGWRGGRHDDGRKYYFCEDRGHEESYRLHIVPREVALPPAIGQPLQIQHLRALLREVDEDGILTRALADENTRKMLVEELLRDPQRRKDLILKFTEDEDGLKALCVTLLHFKTGFEEVLKIVSTQDKEEALRICAEELATSEKGREKLLRYACSTEKGLETAMDQLVDQPVAVNEMVCTLMDTVIDDRTRLGNFVRAMYDQDDIWDTVMDKMMEYESSLSQLLERVCDPKDPGWSEWFVTELLKDEAGRQRLADKLFEDGDATQHILSEATTDIVFTHDLARAAVESDPEASIAALRQDDYGLHALIQAAAQHMSEQSAMRNRMLQNEQWRAEIVQAMASRSDVADALDEDTGSETSEAEESGSEEDPQDDDASTSVASPEPQREQDLAEAHELEELKQQIKRETMEALRRDAQEEARREFTDDLRAKAKQTAKLEMVREFIEKRLSSEEKRSLQETIAGLGSALSGRPGTSRPAGVTKMAKSPK